MAESIKNPERFAGMHWINPPHLVPIIEIIKGEKSINNLTDCTYMILNGAKKRRSLAISAVKALNSQTGIETNRI